MTREEAIMVFQDPPVYGLYAYPRFAEAMSMAIEALEEDVVRCKECRYLKETGGHANCEGYLSCRRTGKAVDDEDYCSWGERI